jgi:hypothetical protein
MATWDEILRRLSWQPEQKGPLLPSDRLSIRILRYADSSGVGEWRPATIGEATGAACEGDRSHSDDVPSCRAGSEREKTPPPQKVATVGHLKSVMLQHRLGRGNRVGRLPRRAFARFRRSVLSRVGKKQLDRRERRPRLRLRCRLRIRSGQSYFFPGTSPSRPMGAGRRRSRGSGRPSCGDRRAPDSDARPAPPPRNAWSWPNRPRDLCERLRSHG